MSQPSGLSTGPRRPHRAYCATLSALEQAVFVFRLQEPQRLGSRGQRGTEIRSVSPRPSGLERSVGSRLLRAPKRTQHPTGTPGAASGPPGGCGPPSDGVVAARRWGLPRAGSRAPGCACARAPLTACETPSRAQGIHFGRCEPGVETDGRSADTLCALLGAAAPEPGLPGRGRAPENRNCRNEGRPGPARPRRARGTDTHEGWTRVRDG